MSDNSEELFPVVADDGSVIGSATRGECQIFSQASGIPVWAVI